MNPLEEYREQIDEVDEQLVNLIAKRFEVVAKIGEYKKAHNLPVFNPAREEEVLRKVARWNPNDFYTAQIQHVYQTMMDEAKQIEK